ncbi:MAG: helix-turn-helix domain-containing protein, partial [Gammaproteobacteria bacterium]|nr:helix-turn-helix domain-containing protein [Gammaproteobacteria bacterium]
VKFQLQGQGVVNQYGREALLNPGDFVLCSSSEPYKLHFPSDYQQVVLSIPQSLLREMFQVPDDYLGRKMDSGIPMHGILSQFVNSLAQCMDLLEPATVQRLEANILDLLITSLQTERSISAPPPINAADKHLHQIKQFIGLNLKDRRLTPDFIAQAEGISKRYLHKLFMDESVSVSRYIQLRRLEECQRVLSNVSMQHLSTTEIALDCGFGDISHFHRCFKSQYKITPRQFRLQANNH